MNLLNLKELTLFASSLVIATYINWQLAILTPLIWIALKLLNFSTRLKTHKNILTAALLTLVFLSFKLELWINPGSVSFLQNLGLSFLLFRFYSLSCSDLFSVRRISTKNIYHELCYLLYSPTIIAGPLIKFESFVEQIRNKMILRLEFILLLCRGIWYLGFFSVVAGNISKHLILFGQTPSEKLGGALASYIELYFNFAGYTDLMRAISGTLGIDLPINFMRPFLARSFADFWSRQHLSLTNWLKVHVYLPVFIYFKKSRWRHFYAIFSVMLLSALWHSLTLRSVIFALIHTSGLIFGSSLSRRFAFKIYYGYIFYLPIQVLLGISVYLLIAPNYIYSEFDFSTLLTALVSLKSSFALTLFLISLTLINLFEEALFRFEKWVVDHSDQKVIWLGAGTALGVSLTYWIFVMDFSRMEFIYSRY